MSKHNDQKKYINDPIHNFVEFDDWAMDFIDTPQFQRLREIKQLGSAYWVYPGACHKRFEHSLGVGYLAEKLTNRFYKEQRDLGLCERDIKCVCLAGLCHDLGHGPFSHIFDNEVVPKIRKNVEWCHEEGSVKMLQYLIDENNIDIEKEDVDFIKALILGRPEPKHRHQEKVFLFDIVANRRNSVDVDKFDYLKRDSFHCNPSLSFDGNCLMKSSRVAENQICYNYKEWSDLYDMFHTRYSLHKKVYNHPKGKAVELMIADAIKEASGYLKIAEAIDDPAEYQNLNDSILDRIMWSKTDDDEGMKKSQEIVKRIRKRDLYKLADVYVIPGNVPLERFKKEVCRGEIVGCQGEYDKFVKDDVIVDFLTINFAMGNKNPLDHIKFFNDWDKDKVFNLPGSDLVPEKCEEVSIRIFAKDPDKVKSIQDAFRKLLSKIDMPNRPDFSLSHTFPQNYQLNPRDKRRRIN